jgi:thioredoxin reductase
MKEVDVIIIGGGPAGLNAAIVLGRCRRNVLLFDTGNQRNRYSHGIHNYLTRDDMLPQDFLQIARKEIRKYHVNMVNAEIVSARKRSAGGFEVVGKNGLKYHSKKILIATGLSDRLPQLEGFREFYGKSIFHCPYCDGWEVRDKKIGLYAKNKNGFELALALTTWSNNITYYSDGRRSLDPAQVNAMRMYGIKLVTDKIAKLEGNNGKLRTIKMLNGDQYSCDALFFVNGYNMQSHIVESLGCNITKKKAVITNKFQQTNIPGLYVAGDAAKDMHFVVVAAAEGAKAGVIINKELQNEERKHKLQRNRKPAVTL